MKKLSLPLLIFTTLLLSCYAKQRNVTKVPTQNSSAINSTAIKLGAFSVSLNVKDLAASKVFYETLGFNILAGDMKKKYLIMKNGNSLIGLFEGMFEKNILTFNPGWDENGKNIEPFDDVRTIQNHLEEKGIKLDTEIDKATNSGPASIIFKDPDGNVILIDQHR